MNEADKTGASPSADWLILILLPVITGFLMVLTHPDVSVYSPVQLPSLLLSIQVFIQGYVATLASVDMIRMFLLLAVMNALSIIVFLLKMALALHVTYGGFDSDILLSWTSQAVVAHVVLMITLGSLGALLGLGLRAYRYRI